MAAVDSIDDPRAVPGTAGAGWTPALTPEGLVHTRVYLDPVIFAQELRRIWSRVWVYVGHDSEIAEPGDYVRRQLGPQPVVLVRDEDGEVGVLVNRCPHRGNLVCQLERGNAQFFRCAYHGWTFKCDGGLLGVTYRKGFRDDQLDELGGMPRVPRVASYRGFVFASLATDGMPLSEQLGPVASRLDEFVDLAPDGEVLLTAGVQKSLYRGNWKLWSENSVDNYHANFVHASQAALDPALKRTMARVSSQDSTALVRELGEGNAELDFRPELRRLGMLLNTGIAQGAPEEDQAAYVRAVHRRLGRERAEALLQQGPPHAFIFPNLFVLQQDARVVQPVAPDRSYVFNYPALLKGAPASVNVSRLRRHENAYGPAGNVLSDDLDVFTRNQRSFADGETGAWLRLERGLHRVRTDDDGRQVGHITDELGQRSFWRAYNRWMSLDEDGQQ